MDDFDNEGENEVEEEFGDRCEPEPELDLGCDNDIEIDVGLDTRLLPILLLRSIPTAMSLELWVKPNSNSSSAGATEIETEV